MPRRRPSLRRRSSKFSTGGYSAGAWAGSASVPPSPPLAPSPRSSGAARTTAGRWQLTGTSEPSRAGPSSRTSPSATSAPSTSAAVTGTLTKACRRSHSTNSSGRNFCILRLRAMQRTRPQSEGQLRKRTTWSGAGRPWASASTACSRWPRVGAASSERSSRCRTSTGSTTNARTPLAQLQRRCRKAHRARLLLGRCSSAHADKRSMARPMQVRSASRAAPAASAASAAGSGRGRGSGASTPPPSAPPRRPPGRSSAKSRARSVRCLMTSSLDVE
mmetsp:Transcript_92589/g.262104  ORF Transcript_92589/g.262104 Transcript_92589/m.262104 type:complete len:275 (-) Transcript_92589:762-1586(-)